MAHPSHQSAPDQATLRPESILISKLLQPLFQLLSQAGMNIDVPILQLIELLHVVMNLHQSDQPAAQQHVRR